MKTVSSKKVGVETSAGGKKIARPDPKAGGRYILLLPDLNQSVGVALKKTSGNTGGKTECPKMDKSPKEGPKNVFGNVEKGGSVSSKGSVSKKYDDDEDLVDYDDDKEEDEEKKKKELENMEKDARKIMEEQIQLDSTKKRKIQYLEVT